VENKSDKLILELVKEGIIKPRFCYTKAQLIIREYFCQIHKDAVKSTEIAKNKKNYSPPNFYD